jgi:glutaminyl-peptide cyclotransferase
MSAIRGRLIVALMLLVLAAAGAAAGAVAQPPVSTPVASARSFEVVARYPHDDTAFTEGLQYIDGQLYESTGYNGQSDLRLVDLQSGEVLERHPLDSAYFGEGITILGDTIYQLTYTTETGFTYDRQTLEQTGTFTYEGEGWGMTTDGTSLIMSNGSNQIVYRDPETFAITRTIDVTDGGTDIFNLNELEYIDGVIWANIWHSCWIARIDPETGKVIDWFDLTPLQDEVRKTKPDVDVLNGIAWKEDSGTVLVTGKYWPTLFEIKLTDVS